MAGTNKLVQVVDVSKIVSAGLNGYAVCFQKESLSAIVYQWYHATTKKAEASTAPVIIKIAIIYYS